MKKTFKILFKPKKRVKAAYASKKKKTKKKNILLEMSQKRKNRTTQLSLIISLEKHSQTYV